ncbi:2345_t:CDS:2 [Acaulospora morrowiae]|uniref:2345_t:CDS:1 n=1 Tax=Acaulospora morrowiae TaxID=94023 RepID=A0A9N8ZRG9_9GLOM|nr:2345_t:CDS:2 [Acaulospora morrowiae]
MEGSKMILASLYIHPVKSCRGIKVDSWRVGQYGLEYDRFWMIVDKNYEMMTQRKYENLALITPKIEESNPEKGGVGRELVLSAPGMAQDLHLPFFPKKELYKKIQVIVWEDQVFGYDCGDKAANWLTTFLKTPARITFKSTDDSRYVTKNLPKEVDYKPETAFADTHPFLLVTEESLQDLNKRLKEPVAERNFRPNIVVKGCNVPYEEDTWKKIIIGDDPENIFYVACRCTRCTVPNVNPETGIKDKLQPSKTLSSYRRVDPGAKYMACFGMNVIHKKIGSILKVGDPITVLEIGVHEREK